VACDAEKRAFSAVVANAFAPFFNLGRPSKGGDGKAQCSRARAVEGQTAQDAVAQVVLANAE
jgi:hypothetical protein